MSRPNPSAFQGFVCWAGLALVTLYLLTVNRSYYLANTQTPTYDEAWYLETSLHLYHRLTAGSLGEFLDAFRQAFGTKAPLISVLPLPFYLLFGASHYAALLVNSLFLVLSNLYLFLLARRLFSAPAALTAVVFYQTMPLVYGLSRSLMAEYGLAALVIVWLYYLVVSEDLSRGSANFALGVVLGLGLLMKILFPVFIAGPLLVVWIARRRQPSRDREGAVSPTTPWLWRACARRPAAAILLPAAAIAGPWYLSNWMPLLRFAWRSAYGDIGTGYGAGGLDEWILLFFNQGISSYYAAALLVFGGTALALPRRSAWDQRALLLLAWLVPPLLAIAAGRNQLIRFIVPLLPVFAIALAVSIFELGRSQPGPDQPGPSALGPGHRARDWIAPAVLAALLAVFPQRLYAALSYFPHPTGHEHAARWGPFVFFNRDLGWAHPPVWESPWEQRRVVEAIHRLSLDAARPQWVIVGVEHVYLNANLLSYLNAYDEYPLQFTSLGYGESSAEKAIDRLYQLDARFLILAEGFQQLPPFLNQVNGQVRDRIDRGDLPFRLAATVSLAHQMKALVYEREALWTSFPPGAKAPDPAHSQIADFTGVRFLGYDWKQRKGALWEISYYWTAAGRTGEDYRITTEIRQGDKVILLRDHFLGGGRHPLREWTSGEVVRETFPVYVPPEPGTSPGPPSAAPSGAPSVAPSGAASAALSGAHSGAPAGQHSAAPSGAHSVAPSGAASAALSGAGAPSRPPSGAASGPGSLEVRLSLTPWGVGPPQPLVRLRLAE